MQITFALLCLQMQLLTKGITQFKLRSEAKLAPLRMPDGWSPHQVDLEPLAKITLNVSLEHFAASPLATRSPGGLRRATR